MRSRFARVLASLHLAVDDARVLALPVDVVDLEGDDGEDGWGGEEGGEGRGRRREMKKEDER